jgi:hypothetical protein
MDTEILRLHMKLASQFKFLNCYTASCIHQG